MDTPKPFAIAKLELWEAYEQVKSNQGMAGVDGQSIGQFEEDLTVAQDEINLPDFLHGLRLYYDASLGTPLSIHWSIPPELPSIQSDRAKLTIVAQNLINNAIKFTERGEIQVSARHIR